MKLELTKEQEKIFNSCRKAAWMHFYPEGKGQPLPGHVLHHIDDALRHTDVERYIEWRIEDLQMMTKAEHISLHHKGRTHSAEHRAKMSESHKGKKLSDETKQKISAACKGANNPNYGRTLSAETKAKMSESLKGRHYYYDKYGQRFRLFAIDPRVINKEVLTLKEYRKYIIVD